MLQDPKRTIGFICPSCRQAVILERSAFQLAASHSTLECPCHASCLEVELVNDKVKLTVPCLFCEQNHVVTCSAHAFLHEKTIAFSCGASGLDCCYVGENESVYAAMRRLEETVDELEEEAGSSGMFLNDVVMEEILSEVRDIAQREGISCTCGSKEWSLKVNYSSVELVCNHCGGGLKIPAATLSDLEDLCCKPILTIHGAKS
jgi:hypothetical protein